MLEKAVFKKWCQFGVSFKKKNCIEKTAKKSPKKGVYLGMIHAFLQGYSRKSLLISCILKPHLRKYVSVWLNEWWRHMNCTIL